MILLTTMGVISHLEPNTLECEIKWTLGSITLIKASGVDGIPAELFQILKDNAVKGQHSIRQLIWKTQQGPGTGKSQFLFQSQRRAVPKSAQTTGQLCSFPILVRLCSKSFKIDSSVQETRTSRCTSWI